MKRIVLVGIAMVFVSALAGCTSATQASTVDEQVAPAAAVAAPAMAVASEAAAKAGTPKVFDAPPKVGDKAVCPVMGGEFIVTEKSERSQYNGKHVAFCCPGCKPTFDADPAKYLN